MGKIQNHLAKVITEQVMFNPDLNPSNLWDEIIEYIRANYADYGILTKIKHPDLVKQSDNFKYLIDTKSGAITVINKFHN